jgi:cysteine desulfurase
LHPLEDLKKQGWEITLLQVDKNGLLKASEVLKAIRPETVLISIMYANNEIGSIEPIAEIGRELLKYRKENKTIFPYFHTDACQAAGYLDLDVEKLHVDLMTVNGSKMYGPKGVGMLYVRRGVKIKSLISGGSQERHLRAGTENIAGIVGFAKAFELVQKNKGVESDRLSKLTSYLWSSLQKYLPEISLNGPALGEHRLPNNLNIAISGIEGEAALLYLDEYGIMCSTGSACTASSIEPSHVLRAIGLNEKESHSSLRFTLGHCNTKKDIDYLMKYFPEIIKKLRAVGKIK